ncbi:nuclear transport factor 2 family protein [Ancylobacter terrae]|uniref:nuclear transport factor 2 family protein n=1 Tax=Ancylobacter sp. sgz301288 TaxID=3342077 RepID=UPI003859CC49
MDFADELKVIEQQLLDPSMRADAGFVGRTLADDFREIGQSGRIYDKPAVMRELRRAPGFEGARTLADFEAREVQAGLVLVTYRIAETGTIRSSLWRQAAAGWELLFHQGTRPAAGARRREATIRYLRMGRLTAPPVPTPPRCRRAG